MNDSLDRDDDADSLNFSAVIGENDDEASYTTASEDEQDDSVDQIRPFISEDSKNDARGNLPFVPKRFRGSVALLGRRSIRQETREKVAFCVGVGGIWTASFIMGRYPCMIQHWFAIHALILLSVRWYTYRRQLWHYFLADLCYFVNGLLLLWLYVLPHARGLYVAVFCLANGPILWAILAWRNSLVFHSLDKITSLFIHIGPPLTLYTLRWLCHGGNTLDGSCSFMADDSLMQRDSHYSSWIYQIIGDLTGNNNARDAIYIEHHPVYLIHGTAPTHGNPSLPVLESLLYAIAFYALWQALYALFIMICQSHKVERGQRMTSYSWLLDPAKNARKVGVMYRLCTVDRWGPGKYQLVLFVFWQFAYALLTIVPTLFMYQSFLVHTILVGGIACASVWNGANYYMDIFRHRSVPPTSPTHQQTSKD